MVLSWDVDKILSMLWHQRRALYAAIAFMYVLALLYMHLATPKYTESLQLVPAPDTTQSSGALGSLSALAGIKLKSGDNADIFDVYLAGLQSHAVSEVLAKNQSLLKRMYTDQWSESEHKWRQPIGLLHPVGWLAKAILGITTDPWTPPSADDVYKFLQDNIDVAQGRDTPVVTVTMKSKDRQFASDFLMALMRDDDQLLRNRALDRANNYIEFLQKEMNSVTVAEYRSALVEHLYDQEKSRMLASASNVTYAAEVFSGPMSSKNPTSPNIIAALLAATVAGLAVGFGLALYLELHGLELVFPRSFRGLKGIKASVLKQRRIPAGEVGELTR
ncbi:MAG: hypothetical protein KGJ78_16775 [Alphaproteobacteria bacterium]|nr:hypothetical protein [Alphaproteobacteria bacterium]